MRFVHWFFWAFCLLSSCAGGQETTKNSSACPMRPTTSAKKTQVAGQTWIIVSVVHPINQPVSCEGEFEGGVPFRNLIHIADLVQGRGGLKEGEYYGIGLQDCVCEGAHGYISFMRSDRPVIYCLSPDEARSVNNYHGRSVSRSN